MAPPTFYTETSLAEYAHQTIRDLAEKVGWSPDAGFYGEVVNEVMLILDVANFTSLVAAADLRQLRAVTRREAWKAVLGALASKHAFGADFQTFSRQQMFDMASTMYEMAVTDCAALGIGDVTNEAIIQRVPYIQDPYLPRDMSDLTLVDRTWP